MPTLFSKIIDGQLDSYKIYEDDFTFALLDIFPYQKGHTLIVPKIEVDYFVDVPEPFYSAVFKTAQKISPAIQKATNCLRVGMMVQGVEVPHFHLHLIPMFENRQFLGKKMKPNALEMRETQAAILKYLL